MSHTESVLGRLLSSGLKGDLVVLFRKNPGIMDTREGVARRLGATTSSVTKEISELVQMGFLKERKFGKYEVVYLDVAKDKIIQESVYDHVSRTMLDEEA
jgi:predicted transcriptional regulator